MAQVQAQVQEPVLISEGHGGFTLDLEEGFNGEGFGRDITTIPDLNGDGIDELAVASSGEGEGRQYILFLREDGTVWRDVEITKEMVPDSVNLGGGVEVYRDLDGDGIPELLLRSGRHLAVLYLRGDGTVKESHVVYEYSGASLTWINEGVPLRPVAEGYPEVVVGIRRETLRFLFKHEIGYRELQIDLRDLETFTFGDQWDWGKSMTVIGDLDRDGFNELAVGAPGVERNALGNFGATWIFSLQPILSAQPSHDDSVSTLIRRHTVIRTSGGPMSEVMGTGNDFGRRLVALPDLDGNGVRDLAIPSFDEPRHTWVLFLNDSGGVEWFGHVPEYFGGVRAGIEGGFAAINDLNHDGAPELVYGDTEFEGHGAIRISFDLAKVAPRITVETPKTATFGDPIVVDADIRSTVDVESADISFRPSGYPTYFGAAMDKLDRYTFSGSVPAFFQGEGGFDYFITTDSPPGRYPESGYLSLPSRHPAGLALPNLPQTGNDYELVSIPLLLDSTDVRANFEDDLGEYDPSAWRLFELDAGDWVELGTRELSIEPGKALALRRSDANRLVKSSAGQTVPTDKSFPIVLDRGWNLIGNPFAFEIPVANLSLSSGLPVELWAYTDSWSVDTTSIRPFSGYAIFQGRDPTIRYDTLWISPDLTPAVDGTHVPFASPRISSRASKHKEELEILFARLDGDGDIPRTSAISDLHNYPNPFATDTKIMFALAEAGNAELVIYDAVGRRVRAFELPELAPGPHEVTWDGCSNAGIPVSAGAYFYKITSSGTERSGSMVLAGRR